MVAPATPQTLQEWRAAWGSPDSHAGPRRLWIPLEGFFLSHGYTLWVEDSWNPLDIGPKDAEARTRTPDGFAYSTVYNQLDEPRFSHLKSIHCPASTADGRYVLIRLMAIGNDHGENHRAALQRLATGSIASRGDNHIVPLLQSIAHEDMIFGVFPLLSVGFDTPWFFRFHEIIEAIDQVLEGVAFCHDHLVAHLDIDTDNILINFVGGKSQAKFHGDPQTRFVERPATPFRSLFPVRYYLNDFELAVTFDPSSDPSSRLVTGLPINGIRTGEYGRAVAPEMLYDSPYCPFRADVWQLGSMFKASFGHLGHISNSLIQLIEEMCAQNPDSRPLASVALQRVREISKNLPREVMDTSEMPVPPLWLIPAVPPEGGP